MPPPNVLYIFTDQQFAGTMSCAGNRDLHTPAMDRLARDGVRFERAYCTFPLCTPSRVSMITGRMPHELGVSGNSVPDIERVRDNSLGLVFQRAGYDCAWGGKWHVNGIEMQDGFGFERISGFNDHQLAPACAEFMQRKRDKPWLLVASFDNPHNICEWARNQALPWGDVPRVNVDDCPTLPANYAVAPYAPQCLERERAHNHAVHPTNDASDDWWRHFRYAYYRLVEKVDAQVGVMLDALQASGQADNTLVVFSSDHGDGHGAHHWNQKTVLYEESIRIPLIVSFPGRADAGRIDREHLVSNGLDLLPTLCDFADIAPPPPPPEGLAGRSLKPLVCGDTGVDWREDLVVETHFVAPRYLGTQGRCVLHGAYKYTRYNWGRYREQLIDLESDPGEMVNLAVSGAHRATCDDMNARLRAISEATGDPIHL